MSKFNPLSQEEQVLYLPLQRTAVKYGWVWEQDDRLLANIVVRRKGTMSLYNYGDMVLVPRNHPLLVRCRGLVVNEDGTVLNYPFDRFFNHFEQECQPVDWTTARVQEKVDGSLICLFPVDGTWEITTRGSFWPNEQAMVHNDVDFAKLFRTFCESKYISLDELSRDYCYQFEIVTKQNRIVTWYDDERLYLLGARNLATHKEMSQADLDVLADKLGVKRPTSYEAFGHVTSEDSNLNYVLTLFDKLRNDEEGLVVVDGQSRRVKVKQESYIRLSRIKMLKDQDLFDFILGKTPIDQEYLAKLPEVTAQIDLMRAHWEAVQAEVRITFDKLKGAQTRKEFALEAIKYPYKSALFTLLNGRDYTQDAKWESVSGWLVRNF